MIKFEIQPTIKFGVCGLLLISETTKHQIPYSAIDSVQIIGNNSIQICTNRELYFLIYDEKVEADLEENLVFIDLDKTEE